MAGRNRYKRVVVCLLMYTAVFVAIWWYLQYGERQTTATWRLSNQLYLTSSAEGHDKNSLHSRGGPSKSEREEINSWTYSDNDLYKHTPSILSTAPETGRGKGEAAVKGRKVQPNRPKSERKSVSKMPPAEVLTGQENSNKTSLEKVVRGTKSPTDFQGTSDTQMQSESDFQAVHSEGSVLVYSAHYDDVHNPPVITVVAIVNRSDYVKWEKGIHCLYDWRDSADGQGVGQRGVKATGKVSILPDHHGATFGPAFIYCPLDKNTGKMRPSLVSVSIENHKSPENHLQIQYPQPRRFRFLLCFSPLHGRFNDVTLIVQNLELARILGADYAVVYNNSLGPGADKVLKYYVKRGFLEVRGWRNLPQQLHYKGQIGAINDCLLLNRNRSEYIVYMDFDEMIVPKFHDSWSHFMHDVNREFSTSENKVDKGVFVMSESLTGKLSHPNRSYLFHPEEQTRASNSSSFAGSPISRDVGAYAFTSSIFLWDKPENLTSDDLRFANKHHVPFLLKQRRIVHLSPERSKNIVNPRTVQVMGIHRVHHFTKRQKTLMVNESVALLYHFRWYSPNAVTVKDISGIRFARLLVDTMRASFAEIEMFRV